MGRRLHRIVFLCTLELLICVIFRLKAEAIGSSFRACNFVTRVLPKECCLARGEIWEREGIDGEEHFILSIPSCFRISSRAPKHSLTCIANKPTLHLSVPSV
uniref:Putative secreted protein n=1 Tax=Rhipicephalus microplus TaxID=6941 RepID=A0A6G5A0L5_RHIMP